MCWPRAAILQRRFSTWRDGSDGGAQSVEIVVAIEHAENQCDRLHVMCGQAVGGSSGVARGSRIEDRSMFCTALVPVSERAEPQPIALRVIGQLADLSGYA